MHRLNNNISLPISFPLPEMELTLEHGPRPLLKAHTVKSTPQHTWGTTEHMLPVQLHMHKDSVQVHICQSAACNHSMYSQSYMLRMFHALYAVHVNRNKQAVNLRQGHKPRARLNLATVYNTRKIANLQFRWMVG